MPEPLIFRTLNTQMPLHPEQQRVITIIMPLFVLLVGITVVAFQLLHLTFVHAKDAQTPEHYASIATTISSGVTYSQDRGLANPQQRITLSINLYTPHQTQSIPPTQNATTHIFTPTHTSSVSTAIPTILTTTTNTALCQYLRQKGFTITSSQPQSIMLNGTIKQTEQTFLVTIHAYTSPDGQNYYSNINLPHLPGRLAVDIRNINGLNNIQQTRIIYHGIRLILIPHRH